ncbi:MAG: hypothetical protein LBG73_10340 [Spirochaetaceae bacterium]|nr:hypothetical protein [Spirochaetaceae bacterium]
MKKIATLALTLALGGSALFALEEDWFTIGFEFSNYIEHSSDGTKYIGGPGINVKGYSFNDNHDIGFFILSSILFPLIGIEDETFSLQDDIIVGPGFRYRFSDRLALHFGAGIDFLFGLSLNTKDQINYTRLYINWGIGGDLGLKFDISDVIYIDLGTSLSCFFLGYESLTKSFKRDDATTVQTDLGSGRIQDFVSFGIKPYIGIGFNVYQEKPIRGKPPKN